MGRKIELLLPEKINGFRKTERSIYVPTKDAIKKHLERLVPKTDSLPAKYIPQGNENLVLAAARSTKSSVMLSGPTGVGKTLLVSNYAAEEKLPLLILTAHEDLTDGKIRGTSDLLIVPASDEGGNVHDLKIKTFAPTHLVLAAMADMPVVLFVDELHKVREGVSSLFHSVTNERMVYCHELTGENYRLHDDTLVIASVNPSYGDGGIDRIDPALRRRFTTIDLQMPRDIKLMEIVKANIGSDAYEEHEPLIMALVKVQGQILDAFKGKELKPEELAEMSSHLRDPATVNSLIEAPSPDSIVKTIKMIAEGLDARTAIEVQMINQIINDFGGPKAALITVIEEELPSNYR